MATCSYNAAWLRWLLPYYHKVYSKPNCSTRKQIILLLIGRSNRTSFAWILHAELAHTSIIWSISANKGSFFLIASFSVETKASGVIFFQPSFKTKILVTMCFISSKYLKATSNGSVVLLFPLRHMARKPHHMGDRTFRKYAWENLFSFFDNCWCSLILATVREITCTPILGATTWTTPLLQSYWPRWEIFAACNSLHLPGVLSPCSLTQFKHLPIELR